MRNSQFNRKQTNTNKGGDNMKTVNLEEILKKHSDAWFNDVHPYNVDSDADEYRINAMREACNLTVELCAENARTTWEGSQIDGGVVINKQSILNTKNQIK